MFLYHLITMAQATPAEEVTPGALISGMFVLIVMAASLGMIVVWINRLRETGHALPAAERGILRVPPVLTIIAIGLSLLMIILMGLVALEDRLLPPVAAAQNSAAAEAAESKSEPPATTPPNNTNEEPANEKPGELASGSAKPEPTMNDSPTDDDSVDSSARTANEAVDAATSGLTPEDMKRALVHTVIMNVIFLVVLGSVMFLASSQGRVSLATAVDPGATAPVRMVRNAEGYVSNSLWPDLDEGPEILPPPENLLSAHVPVSGVLELRDAFDSPFAAPAESSMAASAGSGLHFQPTFEEPFSWATEWRFAGEVFLAAYVPTAFLRIIIVLLTVGILGQEPEQHPFLEMMDSGVGTALLMLIVLTAVFMAPLVEELQFRVVMLGGIAQLGHPTLGLIVSSLLFAFAHGFPDSLALVPLAFALGYTYLRRRSYITVMMVHFLFNGFNMVLALIAML